MNEIIEMEGISSIETLEKPKSKKDYPIKDLKDIDSSIDSEWWRNEVVKIRESREIDDWGDVSVENTDPIGVSGSSGSSRYSSTSGVSSNAISSTSGSSLRAATYTYSDLEKALANLEF